MSSTLLLISAILAIVGFLYGKHRVLAQGGTTTPTKLLALPHYYGVAAALWAAFPTLLLAFIFLYLDDSLLGVSYGSIFLMLAAALFGVLIPVLLIQPSFAARHHLEAWFKFLLYGCTLLSVLITAAIVLSVAFEAIRFFNLVSVSDFLFGTAWSPQTALRADQAGSSGSFGAIPVFLGTFLITCIALIVAVPLGLFSAIYLSEYASPRFRNYAKPALEVLAGVPTVVYGFFAVTTFAPFLRELGAMLSMDIASESALSAGIVMGMMIIPFMMSLSDDVMKAVPRSLRDASLALGATPSETIAKVVIPAALPGIMSAFLLALSRGVGETMIVMMAAGLAAQLTINPFEAVTTVTAQIVTLLVGDHEFNSPKTLAAFALGLTLFVFTLLLNVIALKIVKKYREQYD